MCVPPETRYARSGDVSIAYQVPGRGRSTWSMSRPWPITLSWPGSIRSSRASWSGSRR